MLQVPQNSDIAQATILFHPFYFGGGSGWKQGADMQLSFTDTRMSTPVWRGA
jgi:hypothetical protein